MTQFPQCSVVMPGTCSAWEEAQSSENFAPGDWGCGLWGGVRKVRWCLFLHLLLSIPRVEHSLRRLTPRLLVSPRFWVLSGQEKGAHPLGLL